MDVGSLLEQTVSAVAVAVVTQAVEDRGGAVADRNAAISYGALGLGGLLTWYLSDRGRQRNSLLSNLGKGAWFAGVALAAAAGTRQVDLRLANAATAANSQNHGAAPAAAAVTAGNIPQIDQPVPGALNAAAAAQRFGYGYGALVA